MGPRIFGAVAVLAAVLALPAMPEAQTLVDRVVARVNGVVLLMSDVRAARMLGLVAGTDEEAAERLIERTLLLSEVARFPPPEPSQGAIDAEQTRLSAVGGPDANGVLESLGFAPTAVREMARDSLRIQAYVEQRFGVTIPLTDDQVREYYQAHPELFQQGGALAPFEEVEPDVRRRAALARRETIVGEWVRDLRERADVVLPRPMP